MTGDLGVPPIEMSDAKGGWFLGDSWDHAGYHDWQTPYQSGIFVSDIGGRVGQHLAEVGSGYATRGRAFVLAYIV